MAKGVASNPPIVFSARMQGPEPQLQALGLDAYWYYFPIILGFHSDDPSFSSPHLPFRVDTCSPVSILPEVWVTRDLIRPALCSGSVILGSAAGANTITGQMTRQTKAYVPTDSGGPLIIDFLVTPSLTKYGLFGLRDLLQYYNMETENRAIPNSASKFGLGPLPRLLLHRR